MPTDRIVALGRGPGQPIAFPFLIERLLPKIGEKYHTVFSAL